jgi:hypothetical protein
MKLYELKQLAEVVQVPAEAPAKALPPWKGDGYDTAGNGNPDEVESITDFIEKSWGMLTQAMELLGLVSEMDYVSVSDRAEIGVLSDNIKKFLDANAENIAEVL